MTADAGTFTADPSGAELPTGSLLAGRYRIDGLLGIGGMGMVYRAFDLDLQVAVALKLLRPELSSRAEAFDRFRQEVLLARQVSSPHVLRIHDIARDGERWFISMDLIEGASLDQRLTELGPLPLEEALRIAADLARGLQAAHAQGVIHRDLKPSNILLDGHGRACIADFGIARSLRSSGLTRSGSVIGTPDYLSPEQARGQPVDARSDLYALGLVLYEMLSGRLPFSGETAAEQLSQRIGGYAVPLQRWRDDLPGWLYRLVGRLLRPQPWQRLASAEAVLEVLSSRRLAASPWSLRPLPALALLGLLLALGGLGWWRARAPGVAAEAPVVERLLLWVEADPGSGISAPEQAALADWLRRWLSDASRLPVIDSERSASLQRRWRGSLELAADRQALQREIAHDHLLQLRWLGTASPPRWQAMLWRHPQPAPLRSDLDVPAVPDVRLLQQLQAVWAEPLQLEPAPTAWLQADSTGDLAPVGEALQARSRGRIEAAVEHLQPAQGAAANDLLSLSLLLELALLSGDPARIDGAVQGLQPWLQRFPQSQLQGLQRLAHGEDAVAWWSARLAARPHDSTAGWRLAEAAIAQGDFDTAAAALQLADDGDPRSWQLRGKLAILRGDMRAAVDELLLRALLLSKRDRNRFAEAEAVNALGIAYARLGQMDDAQEQYQRALSLRETIGHRRGIASTLRNLAQIALVQGRRAEARVQLDRARALFNELEDLAGLAAVDNELGVLAEEAGDYAAALTAYRQALRSREAVADRHGIAESQNNLGYAQYQLGDFDSARVFWLQAQESYRQLDDAAGQVRVEQNLGLLAIQRGEWSRAEQLLQHSLAAAERQQLAEEAAVSRRNLAELAWLRGDLQAALSQLEAAATLFDERDDRRGKIDLGLLQARLQLAAGRPQAAAAAVAEQAAELAQASPEQQALAALLRADAAERQADRAAAAAALQQAVEAAAAAGVRSLQWAVELRASTPSVALPAALEAADHRPLRLAWLARQLAALTPAEAWAAYQQASAWLSATPDYVDAWRIHALGARACRAAAGNDCGVPKQRAEDALARLRAGTPEAWQDDLQASAEALLP